MELPGWLNDLWHFILIVFPVLLWMAFWLFAVNWPRMWKFLADGAWVPVVLLGLVAALVWSRIAPAPCTSLGFVTIPNFLWQLAVVAGLVCGALFSGWLQGLFHIQPFEANFDPPADHGHGHDHHGHH